MTQSTPLISIIVPVYNAEKFIAQGLTALSSQTYTHIEILCVDDGSKDQSAQIIDDFASRHACIKSFHQSNAGPAAARNTALKQASGEYIMFCDADDYYEPEMCRIMLETLLRHKTDLVMCDCFIEKTAQTSRDDVNNTDENYLHLKLPGAVVLDDDTKFSINNTLWSKIFKKEIIDRYSISFPVGYEHDDSAFVWQYLCVSQTYYGLSQQLYHYVVHPDSLMTHFFSSINGAKKLDFVYALAYFLQFLHKNNLQDTHISYFELIFIRYFSWYFNLVSPLTKISLLKTVRDEIIPLLPAAMIQKHGFLQAVMHQAYDRLVNLSWADRKQTPSAPAASPASAAELTQQVLDKCLAVVTQQNLQNETQYIELMQTYHQLTQLVSEKTTRQQQTLQPHITYQHLGEARLLKQLFAPARTDDLRLIGLLAQLDAQSSETVIKIVQRLMWIKSASDRDIQQGLSFYDRQEQQQLSALFRDFVPHICHLNEQCHLYHDYVLPLNFFSPHIFYNNHSLNRLSHPDRIRQKTILDMHGAIGDSVLLFQQLQPQKIMAFEQDTQNRALMTQTLALNNITNTDICDADWSPESGTTLDQYLTDCPPSTPVALIKINSETATLDLLHGAVKTIRQYRPTLMIYIAQDWDTFLETKPFIASLNLGYRFTVHKPVTTCMMLDTVLIAEQP